MITYYCSFIVLKYPHANIADECLISVETSLSSDAILSPSSDNYYGIIIVIVIFMKLINTVWFSRSILMLEYDIVYFRFCG